MIARRQNPPQANPPPWADFDGYHEATLRASRHESIGRPRCLSAGACALSYLRF